MPIFTTTIGQQNQASVSGLENYPIGNMTQQYGAWYDCFNRETLNPSSTWAMYTVSNGAGTGTGVIEGDAADLILSTTAANNDNTTIRTSGHIIKRTSLDNQIDNRGTVTEIDIVFSKVQGTSVQGFIGAITASVGGTFSAISALPTTTPGHMGVYWDSSVDANMYLTSSDATTQTKTSMGAVGNGINVLKIFWTGLNSATITLSSLSAGVETGIGSQTVSALEQFDIGSGYQIQSFVKTLTTAAKFIRIYEIKVKYT